MLVAIKDYFFVAKYCNYILVDALMVLSCRGGYTVFDSITIFTVAIFTEYDIVSKLSISVPFCNVTEVISVSIPDSGV